MANFDTIDAHVGGTGREQINVLTLTSATETLLLMGTDTSGTTVTAVLGVPTGSRTDASGHTLLYGAGAPVEFNQNGAVSSQSKGRKASVFTASPNFSVSTFDSGRPFRIRLFGTASVAAVTVTTVTNSIVVAIYQGTAIVATRQVSILTAGGSSTSTTAAAVGQFFLDTTVQWDSVNQVLGGWYGGNALNTLTASHALGNAVSVTTANNLQFCASATFGHAEGGTVTVSEFSIEQV